MTSYIQPLTTHIFQPHEPQYWPARRLAFAEIRKMEELDRLCEEASDDSDLGDAPYGPDYVGDLEIQLQHMANNSTVISILTAQGRMNIMHDYFAFLAQFRS